MGGLRDVNVVVVLVGAVVAVALMFELAGGLVRDAGVGEIAVVV